MNRKLLITKFSRWTAISVTTFAPVTLLMATPPTLPSGEVEIADYMKMDMNQDQRLGRARIELELNDGIATLAGTVESPAHAERASSRAVANAGVRAVVTLTGNVSQVSERDAVESTARNIPGIVRVVNDLRVTDENNRGGKLPDIMAASPPLIMRPR